MINFCNNRSQFKNWELEERKAAIFEGYEWEVQRLNSIKWIKWHPSLGLDTERVYRLAIEDDKWYWIEDDGGEQACLGEFINKKDIGDASVLRPAKPEEVPSSDITYWMPIPEFKEGD